MTFKDKLEDYKTRTNLEKEVKKILLDTMIDCDTDEKTKVFFNKLMLGGCRSGMIGELVFTTDCIKFFERNKNDIEKFIKEYMDERGYESLNHLFGHQWDNEDIFITGDNNRTILAWFSFEEMAYWIAFKIGIEL